MTRGLKNLTTLGATLAATGLLIILATLAAREVRRNLADAAREAKRALAASAPGPAAPLGPADPGAIEWRTTRCPTPEQRGAVEVPLAPRPAEAPGVLGYPDRGAVVATILGGAAMDDAAIEAAIGGHLAEINPGVAVRAVAFLPGPWGGSRADVRLVIVWERPRAANP